MARPDWHRRTPITLWKQGLDWGGRSSRLQYLTYLLSFFVVFISFSLYRAIVVPPVWVEYLGWGLSALMIVPLIGHGLRRLNDIGRAGWWYWITLVPLLGFFLHVYLLVAPTGAAVASPAGAWRRAGFVVAGVCALGLAMRMIWEPVSIPSGSMKPQLRPDDIVLMRKTAPRPERGAVLVLRHPTQGILYAKRLIGLPGETVEIRDGVPVIDGQSFAQARTGLFTEPFVVQGATGVMPACLAPLPAPGGPCNKTAQLETTPEGKSYTVLDSGHSFVDDMAQATIPPGHYFFLGDNRDNSLDSRVAQSAGGLGMVPARDLYGTLESMLLSTGGNPYTEFWNWRTDRLGTAIE